MATPHAEPGAVGTWNALMAFRELCARLRLACEALSAITGGVVLPADVRLDDLEWGQRQRLLDVAAYDVWDVIQRDYPAARAPKARVVRCAKRRTPTKPTRCRPARRRQKVRAR